MAGRKVDHSPPPRAEAKNRWIHSFPSPYTFLACTEETLPVSGSLWKNKVVFFFLVGKYFVSRPG